MCKALNLLFYFIKFMSIFRLYPLNVRIIVTDEFVMT
jgi:hypothetical protein